MNTVRTAKTSNVAMHMIAKIGRPLCAVRQ